MNRQQRRAAAKGKFIGPATMAAGPAASVFAAAVRHHAAGRLTEAEVHYRRVLTAHPNHADAAFNLGVTLRQLGKVEEAIIAYAQALRIKPDYPDAHFNLGNALMATGKAGEAIIAYAHALRIKPNHASATTNLAVAYSHLGVALMDQRKYDAAAAAFAEALALNPGAAETHYNLGNVRKHQDKLDDAAASYCQALAINPNLAEAQSNLGNTLAELGRFDEAIAAHTRAIALRADSAEMRYNLGNVLKDQGKLAAAVDAYKQALRLDPDHAGANANLGIALMSQGRLDDAIDAYSKAIALKPDDADTFSNLLFCRNYDGSLTPSQLLAAHCEWDERYGARPPRPGGGHTNDRTPERRLKIGYVSPDFRTHSVAYFLAPLFEAHDHNAIEVFCYADVIRPDAVTAHLRGLADHWLEIVGMPDDALADRIRADGIDILVDLAGHTAHNRLRVFARKPAPVQVTYLGYSNTTGLRTIDYRFVDDITDPPGAADACAAEILLRLPGGFLCYGAPPDTPQPVPPPCLKTGAITFGSFNNPAKVSAATFDVWARLLAQLPNARLLLKGKPFADDTTRAMFLARLAERDIEQERVQLVGWVPSISAHLALYEQIDIALDPFPYNGTTTTCEALWMAVPVVTLQGDRHSARVGASLLTQAGMTDWIAKSVDEYVQIALGLAADPAKLLELRRGLRQRLAASRLCDGNAFARKFENAYRSIWRGWCEGSGIRS
jgi:predicted O-linked N-acetylglucosamine transferase (SPINDLY family)